ncbi:unnamed protein product [Rhizoctonia solani]|uniref:DNA 3'-5' helicase n=1 Tax=Rhizoctonia solani TaxID=456999 RepID=A0A8H2Y2S6_9AGAM|nr:unnamed protein product [Rhizoctonia solani]
MELAILAENIPNLPWPLTLEQQVIINTWEATRITPYKYQVRNTLALDARHDVLCVAGTGSGKMLSFVMLCFLRPEVILWIVSPLNFIENQQAEQFRKWKLRAVSVNSMTIMPNLLKDIKAGKYQVIISSPKAYQDANKLRATLLSPELAHHKQVTAIDECHCIVMWGGSFQKAYECIGNMHAFMPDPDNSPMIAATATASDIVKVATLHSLKIWPGYHLENLGNFRCNLRYEVFPMSGGQKSYDEICKLLPPSTTPLSNVNQMVVFVEDYVTVHSVALAIQKHFGLSGKAAHDAIPVYHSLRSELAK